MAARYRIASLLFACFFATLPVFGQTPGEPLNRPGSYDTETNEEAPIPSFGLTLDGLAERAGLSLQSAGLIAAESVWLVKEHREQFWDPSANGGAGDWMDSARLTYTRDAAGRQIGRLLENWDDDAQDWQPGSRQTITRDEQGLAIETLDEGWDENADGGAGAWEPQQRRTASYNGRGNPLVRTTELWDGDDYFIWSRRTSTYDESGDVLLQEVTESGLFGPVVPSLRYTYTYDGGNLTQTLTESYSTADEEWRNFRLDMRAHDEDGNVIERTLQDWDGEAGEWVNADRTLTSISVDETETEAIDQEWDPEADGGAGAWVNADREVFSIDYTTMTATTLVQEWDPDANGGSGAWVNRSNMTAEFSDQFELVQFLSQTWSTTANDWEDAIRGTSEVDENGNVIMQMTEAWTGSEWMNVDRSLITYEEFDVTASERELPIAHFQLDENYPNPFQGSTTISFTLAAPQHVTLEIFDVLGRRVATLVDAMKGPGTHQAALDAGGFSAGLYVYRLSADDHQAARTMLLVK